MIRTAGHLFISSKNDSALNGVHHFNYSINSRSVYAFWQHLNFNVFLKFETLSKSCKIFGNFENRYNLNF